MLIYAVNQSGEIILWNKKVEEVTGYSKQELSGYSDLLKKMYPDPAYLLKVQSEIKRQVNGTSDRPILLRVQAKNGSESTISWISKEIRSAVLGKLEISFGIDLSRLQYLWGKHRPDAQAADAVLSIHMKTSEQLRQLFSQMLLAMDRPAETAIPRLSQKIKEGITLLQETRNHLKEIQSTAAEQTAPLSSGKAQSVLIIDDESIIQDLIQDVLQSEGYSIITARDGETGIRLFRSKAEEIGLVILDVVLPKLDGQTVLSEIRKIRRDVKVLVISGYSKANVKKEMLESGIDGYIAKPFSIVHLVETVESLISGKSA
jgi:PAS domain S-box-containing protein